MIRGGGALRIGNRGNCSRRQLAARGAGLPRPRPAADSELRYCSVSHLQSASHNSQREACSPPRDAAHCVAAALRRGPHPRVGTPARQASVEGLPTLRAVAVARGNEISKRLRRPQPAERITANTARSTEVHRACVQGGTPRAGRAEREPVAAAHAYAGPWEPLHCGLAGRPMGRPMGRPGPRAPLRDSAPRSSARAIMVRTTHAVAPATPGRWAR